MGGVGRGRCRDGDGELGGGRGCRAIMVRDVLALIFLASNEGRVEDGARLRGRRELSVHLWMLGELGLRECGSAGSSALWDIGVDRVTMSRRCRCGIVGDGVEVYHGVSSNHVEPLLSDVFR